MSDMDRIVGRLRRGQAEHEEAQQKAKEAEEFAAEQAERQRVQRLRALLPRWLALMASHDFPEAQLVTLRTYRGRRRNKVKVEEFAGWCIASHGWIDNPRADSWAHEHLHLLIDGRVTHDISGRDLTPDEGPYELGSKPNLEEQIEDTLSEISSRAGVPWNAEL